METGLLIFMCVAAVAVVALSVHEAISLHRELKEYKDLLNNKNHE